MTVAAVPTWDKSPHPPTSVDTESPEGRYLVDTARWLREWHYEYATTLNEVSSGYLPLDGSGTMTGDLAFSGSGLRITGDFSNATIGNRAAFQSSTANGVTSVVAIPNGTSTQSGFVFLSNSNPVSAQPIGVVYQSGTTTYVQASTANGGAQGAIALAVGSTNVLVAESNTDLALGPAGAATGMTSGFPYIPAAAGAPTGTPTVRTGYVPLYYDSTGNNLYCYNGAWKKVNLA